MLQNAAYRILVCFISSNERSFADICSEAKYPTDLGGYYLRQLIRLGYLERGSDRGKYVITAKGRSQLAVGNERQTFIGRPRLIVLLVARLGDDFLIQRRARQPFIGAAEWPATAVGLGESLSSAANRLIADRVGGEHDAQLAGFFRRTDLYNDEVFDDKLFAVHTLELAEIETAKAMNLMGSIELQPVADIVDVAKPARSLFDILDFVKQPSDSYAEHIYNLSASDFEPNVTD